MAANKPHMNIVFVGHVDHGKSTTVGRLFYDAGVLSPQELDKLKKVAQELGKATFEFAYSMDVTKEERKRGVTINLMHKKFDTPKYIFTVIDAPGHKDFVKNMITGASQADAAVLVVSGKDSVQEQTKEHIFLSKTLGVNQLIVAVNKMDAVNYDEKKFNDVVEETKKWLAAAGYNVEKVMFVPESALEGDNVVKKSEKMSWWKGPTLLEALDKLEQPQKLVDLPLRIPIQDSYTITGVGSVPVGKVETGIVKVNDKVIFMPSGKTGEVKTIEMHHEKVDKAEPGDNIGFNVRGIGKGDVARGDVCGPVSNPPTVAKEFTARMFVLKHPTVITVGYAPVFHCHTAQVACKIIKILNKIDPKTGQSTEQNPDFIKMGEAADIVVQPQQPLCIEQRDKNPKLSSFAVRDMGMTVGAGVVTSVVPREQK